MAHSICGIDVGAFSIKLVVFEIGFRQTLFLGAFEEVVSDGPDPLPARQVAALRAALSRISSDATLYLALPGDQLSIRSLELPFSDPRKIEQVIGYQLEGEIVSTLEEVVYDHMVVRTEDDGKSHLLAVAAKRDDVSVWLETLAAGGVEPRALYAAPVIYRALEVDGDAAGAELGRVPAILDVGHARSNLYIGRDGQGIFARTVTRGGQHLTTLLAQAFGVDRDRAEQAKRREARLLPPELTNRTPLEARLDEVLRGALVPLVRDVRQSLASFRAQAHLEVDTLYLTGGGARLAGLPGFLRAELGMPVQFLAVPQVPPDVDEAVPEPFAAEAPGGAGARAAAVVEGGDLPLRPVATQSSPFALSMAVALAASRGRKEIDLRRGPFVYRASFSVVRQKAMHLGLLAAAVLLAGGLDVFASLTNLGNERKGLDAQLKTATQELFGQPRSDARAVTQQLRKGLKEELAPVPKATAFDLLDQISQKIPPADKIKLDVAELEIRAKKTFIKGTVDSATAVDEIADKLKQIDCYDEVTKGAITEVSDGAKQFTLNVAAKCP